jgi:O-antigen/teichoic acid export membrane protein
MSEIAAPPYVTTEIRCAPASPVAPKRLTLRENFVWTLAGNLVYAGCQWGMLVVLAKLGTPEWVGQFALGLAVTAPILLFANLQLRAVQATDVTDQYQFGHYLALRLLMLGLAAVSFVVVIVAGNFGVATALVVAAVGLAKIFESLSDVFYGLLQKHERMDRIAKSMMIKGPLSLCALAAGTYLTQSVAVGVVAMAAVWLCVLLFYDIRNGKAMLRAVTAAWAMTRPWQPLWSKTTLRRLAWLAAPLGVVMMLNSLNVNLPRYFVEHHLGQWQLGIFAALAYLQVAESTVINALGQSATPRLAAHFAAHRSRLFRRLNLQLLGIGLAIGCVGVLVAVFFGRALLTLIYRPQYAEYSDTFVVLLTGAALANVAAFLGYGLTAARRFRIQIPLLLGESAILTVACFYLVPKFGLTGAASAFVIAKGFLIVSSTTVLLRTHSGAAQSTSVRALTDAG